MDEVFGHDSDLGPGLFSLARWHQDQNWNLPFLSLEDIKKADALEAFTGLTRMRISGVDSNPSLNLHLADHIPEILPVVVPMLTKIPVISFAKFLDLHVGFAFDAIRRAKHSLADDLIAYIYEILFIQQKTAISLFEFLRLAVFSSTEKNEALLLNAEVSAIMGADLTFSYLKATIEKTLVIVALTFGIKGLDSQKTHKAKLRFLTEGVPQFAQATPYGSFLFDSAKSENLEELNSYRSGLLHKRGIADLQPHNYVGVNATQLPFLKLFSVLREQHAKNTAMLLCAVATLVDRLVELDPPTASPPDFIHGLGPSFDEFMEPLIVRIHARQQEA